jgi:N-methylhydantoinase B
MILLNDPYRGGTHLPDLTLVAPVFSNTLDDRSTTLLGFVANRAHHADVGGMTPGSMPIAREIYQEGLIIPPVKLIEAGEVNQDLLELLVANVRTPQERLGDLWAQVAANRRGEIRLQEYAVVYQANILHAAMQALIEYTERMTRELIRSIPNGVFKFEDFLDDDGVSPDPVQIIVAITINDDRAIVDFTGSAVQQQGSINAVYAITLSAVYYVFRCLFDTDIPNNAGLLRPIEVIAPQGTIVNAVSPAPVAGGNVETSQRIVDVLLGALAQALPEQIPAASQGTMNNITIGGKDQHGNPFTYYETIAGGMGARPEADGLDGVHTHMTNTLNTPVEALEYAYPLQVEKYEIIRQSGGAGKYRGGNGIRRDLKVLVPAQMTLLTERRKISPYGFAGGHTGKCGKNQIRRKGKEIPLPSKGTFELLSGDIISVQTPGGGGYGIPDTDNS